MNSGELDASGGAFDFDDIKIESGEWYLHFFYFMQSNVTLIDILDLEIENNPDLIYNGANGKFMWWK
ncbi:MAG: hypothetical protein IPL12_08185 [Bacteroidetes bacterium]|nr:hypothetical protein [Bacteroidota bacterium]